MVFSIGLILTAIALSFIFGPWAILLVIGGVVILVGYEKLRNEK